MTTHPQFGRDAAAMRSTSKVVTQIWLVFRWALFCVAKVLVVSQLRLIYLTHQHETVVIQKRLEPGTPIASPTQNTRFQFQEKPFATLYRRASTRIRKRGDVSAWTIRGIARYGGPSFYLGVWESKHSRPLRYDIVKRVMSNNTLTSWGAVNITSKPEMLKTDFGEFEMLRFIYRPQNPRSGAQSCAYFSSIDLPKAFYARGHYCVDAEKKLDVEQVRRTLSSITHVALPAKK